MIWGSMKIEINKDICNQYRVKLLYLFGSKAKNTSSNKSDLDIAALFEDEITDFSLLKRLSELSAELSKNLPGSIDLVSLNNASSLLKYEVIANNQLLYSRNEEERIMYEVLAVKEYIDNQRIRDIYYNALRKRITEGVFS